jgi:hypothetical protein
MKTALLFRRFNFFWAYLFEPRAAVRAKPFYLAGLGRTAVRAHGLKCIGNSCLAGSLC